MIEFQASLLHEKLDIMMCFAFHVRLGTGIHLVHRWDTSFSLRKGEGTPQLQEQ